MEGAELYQMAVLDLDEMIDDAMADNIYI